VFVFGKLVVLVVAVTACCGCGRTDTAKPPDHVLQRPNMHAVRLGMTKAEVQRLLGKPDDLYSLPRGSAVDWIFVYPDGRGVVSFNTPGRVMRVEDCPNNACTAVVP
jgi:outer membrane protein assembly factor BamE (lipoprotein component of BamABCDE complex)